MSEVIEGTVRRHKFDGQLYGTFNSKKLGQYVEQDVRITVERVLCPACQSPLRQGTCPNHGKIKEPQSKEIIK